MNIKKIIFLCLVQSLLSGCDYLSGGFRTIDLVQPNQQTCIISTLNKLPKIKFIKEVKWQGGNAVVERLYQTSIVIPSYKAGLIPTYHEEVPLHLKVRFQSDKEVKLEISLFDQSIPTEQMIEITNLLDRIQIQLSKNCQVRSFGK